MKVIIGGFNVDYELLKQILKLKKLSKKEDVEELKKELENLPQPDSWTPETISAAYARISRSDKSVTQLRAESLAEVAKARRSNKNIIFGMGHESVAEHGVFNFDIVDISRRAVEEIERCRLGSYTEKSQRYVKFKGDYFKPREFSIEDLRKFNQLVKLQNSFYFEACPLLLNYFQKKTAEYTSISASENPEGRAKEDARFSLPLATYTQLGATLNARIVEHLIRRLRNHPLKEVQSLSEKLFKQVKKIAPSLIKYADAEIFKREFTCDLKDDQYKLGEKQLLIATQRHCQKPDLNSVSQIPLAIGNIKLLSHNNPDLQILSAIIFQNSNYNVEEAIKIASQLVNDQPKRAIDYLKDCLCYISEYDRLPRAFEAGQITIQAVVSSACFAQLKRHRMLTLLSRNYDPNLGITVPESIKDVGLGDKLLEIADKSSELYYDFLPKYGMAAEYCLTNAHRREVLVVVNMREVYHISRLRQDRHAQWEINQFARNLAEIAKKVAPLSSVLLGGKDEFKVVREELYSQ